MDVSQRDALFARETLPLWLGLFLIVVAVPFSIMRVGPLPSFFWKRARCWAVWRWWRLPCFQAA